MFQAVEEALEDVELSISNQIDEIIDFCHDSFGQIQELDKDDVRVLISKLNEITL